ncbi:MAG TPA: hypothetical protein VKB29_04850, partial [Candidatus Binataceae bacterium]|nr:hypothetical protein [Candidatus Binataceae bacterium]
QSRPEVDGWRPAPVMDPPTALEVTSWWAPRGLLMGEKVPPRAKQSPLVLPIPWEPEVRRS